MRNLPGHPFRYSAVADLGVSPDQLRRAVEAGRIRRVFRGVYVDAQLPDDLDLRLAAARLVLPTGHIVCDRSAAWVHGVDLHRRGEHLPAPRLETCVLPSRTRTRLTGVRGMSRDLAERDVMSMDGLRVTTPLRTALDLGCALYRRDAMAALDHLRRLHGITADELARESTRFRGRRGVQQLRGLIPWSDPTAESIRESWTRLAILDADLPAPVTQFWVGQWRLDFAYPLHRIGVEYDGQDFHLLNQEQRDRDERRRRQLAEAGWTIIVVRNGDFTGPRLDEWLGRLQRALSWRADDNRRW